MFDRIVYISDHSANVKLMDNVQVAINLMNLHVIFEDDNKKILGEVDDLDGNLVKIRFLGEIVNGKLLGGTIRKPALDAKIRVIDQSEIPLITGQDTTGFMKLGVSPFYNDHPVFLDVGNFFSDHFAIFGNTGSGKSCGVSRVFQNMFHDQRLFPYKSNIFIFDSSGEYYNAFSNLNSINPNFNYRFFSTNEVDGIGEKLRVPIFLLNVTDLALLLQATTHSQLPIIERMLKLALIFSQEDMDANNYKNHLIAKAIMTILYTNETSPNKRNEIFSILASCSTPEFNLEAVVQGIGYTRKFRECFLINNNGQFTESVLLTEYVSSFIKEEYDNYEPKGGVFYTLDTLEKALNFTLISEGWLRNENTYGDAVTIKVRLHSLIVGENAKFFDCSNYISLESYLSSMLIDGGKKYQIINVNLDDVDDDFAKVITKIFSRLIFEFAKGLKDRASIPFHIVVEEAHRYIQNDTDRFLIGYNIFERIAKEGRKYGVILGLISQRPVELSDTVISQCSNFLIFKMNHPVDVDYIRKMVPNISDEIVEKQKTLQAGTCLGFGMAFRIPIIVKMEMPNPAPWSGNCDVVNIWNGNGVVNNTSVSNSAPPAMPTYTAPSNNDAFVSTNNSVPMVNNDLNQGNEEPQNNQKSFSDSLSSIGNTIGGAISNFTSQFTNNGNQKSEFLQNNDLSMTGADNSLASGGNEKAFVDMSVPSLDTNQVDNDSSYSNNNSANDFTQNINVPTMMNNEPTITNDEPPQLVSLTNGDNKGSLDFGNSKPELVAPDFSKSSDDMSFNNDGGNLPVMNLSNIDSMSVNASSNAGPSLVDFNGGGDGSSGPGVPLVSLNG